MYQKHFSINFLKLRRRLFSCWERLEMVHHEPFRTANIAAATAAGSLGVQRCIVWVLLVLLAVISAADSTRDHHAGSAQHEAYIPVQNAFIRHMEAASYDRRLLVRRHARLTLLPDVSLFAGDASFEGSHGPLSFDSGRAYSGTLQDDPRADVKGVVTGEGLFDGSITFLSGEVVFIEPTSRYSGQQSDIEGSPHTLVYRASDVEAPHMPACASERLRNKMVQDGSGSRRKRWVSAAQRHTRAAAGIDPDKTTCMLYLQADHLFHQKFGSEEACIEVMTRHVQRVNSIYQGTDFDQDGRTDSISFMIKRIKVHSADALNDSNYRFPGNYEEDYDAFCLAYMFTYRDFEMGTLGLAWTGDLKNAGGVCEKNGHYRGSMKSLNTGIVTLLNYGKHVPPAVSHVTLAHEIGHNFGSPHDPETCTPGGEDGNFIMFARATSGDKRNNNKFSPCSLQAISPVLANKARSTRGCFTEPQAAICGNGVVEPGEECDCGWEQDCRDACCFPMSSQPRPGEPPCRLTPRSACSPSQGPCCTGECQLRFGDKCREDNGCRDASYCDGRGPACPPSTNKPNKTVCNEEFVCFMGECTGSICLAYGLESCQCIATPRDPPTKACELCCKEPGDDKPCMSSFDWNVPPFDIPDLYSKPGTPCNNYNGYCDVFQKCREVDPSGPLATLRKLLLSDESLATVRRWVAHHWYALLLAALFITGLMVIIARVFGRREDSKLRSVTVMHSSATEPVRLPGTGGGGGLTVHPAVRSRLPLGKRVRAKVTKKSTKPAPSAPAAAATAAMTVATTATATIPAVAEPRKHKKRRRRRKEVIDYSDKQQQQQAATSSPPPSSAEDPLGKVRNWLLSSNLAHAPPSPSKPLPKSKSTPAALQTPSPSKSQKARNKSRSLGNLQAKAGARLQLLCKPPFKLTVKLRRAPREESTGIAAQPRSAPTSRPRTALLIRGSREARRDKRPKAVAATAVANKKATGEDLDLSTVPSDRAVLISGAAVT
ncbi:hypothetical protein B566_EDAN003050 [Ephemera danica]|nr:hypothetical protein B566_EDAN003050 [Ephemera danica]